MLRRVQSGVLQCVAARFLSYTKLEENYSQQAFEALRRFQDSKTYPGAIREATPGDTQHYLGPVQTILNREDRHYWRAVTDDPLVEHMVPMRVRFKDNVWVVSKWEQRMHVIQVMIHRSATVKELIDQVTFECRSPYLCATPFTLAVDGKTLDPQSTLAQCGLNELSQVDAVDDDDHRLDVRPKDWHVDEISAAESEKSPYKEINASKAGSTRPKYPAIPHALGRYGKL